MQIHYKIPLRKSKSHETKYEQTYVSVLALSLSKASDSLYLILMFALLHF